MRSIERKIGGALALVVAVSALAGVACTGGTGNPYQLTPGAYTWYGSSVPTDTCWSGTVAFPPENISFPVTVTTSPQAGTVTMVFGTALANIMARTLVGTVVASQVMTTGFSSFTVSTGCRLAFQGRAFGVLSGDGQAELEIDTTISGISTLGTASNCNAYAGGSYPGTTIPFPSLIGGSNGSCSYGEKGPLTHS